MTLGDKVVSYTDTVKYLGMHLDKGLTCENHTWNKNTQLGSNFHKYF